MQCYGEAEELMMENFMLDMMTISIWMTPWEWLLQFFLQNLVELLLYTLCIFVLWEEWEKKNSCFWLWSFVRFVVIMWYYELVELINFYVNDLFVGPIVCGHDLPKLKKCKMWRVRTRGSILHSKDLAILIYTNVIYSHNINEK